MQRELQDAVLRWLHLTRQAPSLDSLARSAASIEATMRLSQQPNCGQIDEALWGLLARGLVYLDMRQPAATNWVVSISEHGREFLKDQAYNPNDPSQYIARLERDVPGLDDIVLTYLREAVFAYEQQLHLSSTVMLGVAAEAAFLDMAAAFLATLPDAERQKFEKTLQGRANFAGKLDEFKRLLPISDLPKALQNGLETQYSAVQALFRENRNETGHPTGASPDRETCYTSLCLAPPYFKRLYVMKAHFESKTAPGP